MYSYEGTITILENTEGPAGLNAQKDSEKEFQDLLECISNNRRGEILRLFDKCKFLDSRLLFYCLCEERSYLFDAIKEKFKIEVKKIKNQKGQNLLHYAATSIQFHQVEYLLSSGIDINSFDYDGNTPLHLLLMAMLEEDRRIWNPSDFEFLDLLYLKGAKLEARNDNGINSGSLLFTLLRRRGVPAISCRGDVGEIIKGLYSENECFRMDFAPLIRDE
jgi:ankyrin repeat protein